MRTAKKLLTLLTTAFPPFPGAKHAILVYEGKLMIALAMGQTDWKHFTFEDADLDREAEDLLADISAIMAQVLEASPS